MYGCELLSTAQRTRQTSQLDPPGTGNAALLSELTSFWERLSAALVEARARLEVAQQFHLVANEVRGVGLKVM